MTEKIKELCKNNGISVFRLEKELGIGNGTIGKWGKNGRAPNYAHLKKVADYFRVPVSYLTGEEQKEKPPAQGGGLSERDARLVEWFRSLPPEKQKALLISQDGPVEIAD